MDKSNILEKIKSFENKLPSQRILFVLALISAVTNIILGILLYVENKHPLNTLADNYNGSPTPTYPGGDNGENKPSSTYTSTPTASYVPTTQTPNPTYTYTPTASVTQTTLPSYTPGKDNGRNKPSYTPSQTISPTYSPNHNTNTQDAKQYQGNQEDYAKQYELYINNAKNNPSMTPPVNINYKFNASITPLNKDQLEDFKKKYSAFSNTPNVTFTPVPPSYFYSLLPSSIPKNTSVVFSQPLTITSNDNKTKINLNAPDIQIVIDNTKGKFNAETGDGTKVELPKDVLDKINKELISKDIQVSQDSNNNFTFTQRDIKIDSNVPMSVNLATQTVLVKTSKGDEAISTLPKDAIKKINDQGVLNNTSNSVKLIVKNDKPVFQVEGSKDEKLFGLFPVQINKTATVSATTGNVDSIDQTWQSKLLDTISF